MPKRNRGLVSTSSILIFICFYCLYCFDLRLSVSGKFNDGDGVVYYHCNNNYWKKNSNNANDMMILVLIIIMKKFQNLINAYDDKDNQILFIITTIFTSISNSHLLPKFVVCIYVYSLCNASTPYYDKKKKHLLIIADGKYAYDASIWRYVCICNS